MSSGIEEAFMMCNIEYLPDHAFTLLQPYYLPIRLLTPESKTPKSFVARRNFSFN
jgi:hypothetical protein